MKSNVFLLIVMCTSLVFADDQKLSQTQSCTPYKKSSALQMLTDVARYINQKIGIDARYKDASQYYQELAQEAQTVVGLAPEDQLPVKRLENVGNFSLISVMAQPNFILVNEDKMQQYPYGAQRIAFFREAIRIKYADIPQTLLILPAGIITYFLSRYVLNNYAPDAITNYTKDSWLFSAFHLIGCINLSAYVYDQKGRMHRAELEAVHACGCCECVREAAQYRYLSTDETLEAQIRRFQGFAHKEEFNAIVEQLQEKKLYCSYHRILLIKSLCNKIKENYE